MLDDVRHLKLMLDNLDDLDNLDNLDDLETIVIEFLWVVIEMLMLHLICAVVLLDTQLMD